MRFLLIRHWPEEAPGLIGDALQRREIDCHDAFAFDPKGLPSSSDFDGLALFGSPESCRDAAIQSKLGPIHDLVRQFVDAAKPVLGVCFGGQVLAESLGAKVLASPKPEIGACEVRLTEAGRTSPFFEGFPPEFTAAQWHSDMFEVPTGASLLATSDGCAHQAFSIGRSLAVQFHPELSLARGRQWAAEYGENPTFGKSAAQVLQELEATHEERSRMCDLLVRNFLRAAQ